MGATASITMGCPTVGESMLGSAALSAFWNWICVAVVDSLSGRTQAAASAEHLP